ncbi:hypothetical protein D7X96_16415 [Corallococcus interemptor]|uniref:Uncharacterized protein n=1 Tax=Corallococcus interemptor TaxID=2316720 RepID=A0A3A8QPI4_9BACT|nr:hypothetical protein [Corallococcus interemptor]RKH68800.1 hypothetical protein D7X96_16415 [Corallococcus interemptor]
MHLSPFRLLAFVAGGLLCVIPSPRAAHAGTKAIRLPPQLTGASQSAEDLPSGGNALLSIQAMDPQGSPLTFSWSASAGTLGTAVNTGTSSSQTWTAPQCLPPDAAFTSLVNTALTPEATLRMALPSVPTSAERIVFAQDQQLRVTFVDHYSAATHALGFVYYDDLVARGYVNPQGTPDSADDTLVDANGNGIMDLHEDLYGLAPTVPETPASSSRPTWWAASPPRFPS